MPTPQVDSCTTQYMKFDLEGGRNVILDRAAAIADGPTILQQHAIAFDRSTELREATRHVTAAAPASGVLSPLMSLKPFVELSWELPHAALLQWHAIGLTARSTSEGHAEDMQAAMPASGVHVQSFIPT